MACIDGRASIATRGLGRPDAISVCGFAEVESQTILAAILRRSRVSSRWPSELLGKKAARSFPAVVDELFECRALKDIGSFLLHPAFFSTQIPRSAVDGAVLVFGLENGTVRGPIRSFEIQEDGPSREAAAADLTRSVTALHLYQGRLFAGSSGRCTYWTLGDGELQREFHLPGTDEQPATACSLVVVPQESALRLWVGLDNGQLVVFEVETGMLVRSFSCCGPEMVSAVAFCEKTSAVFALSAHKRVSIWDSKTFACLQKYPAELMMPGPSECCYSTP
ncbi:unnamed protein product [Symbiodinium microadriaticum]|nr:unnamed protein product [Symbiodinium microadriaticum]CAE7855177.1 unnamed protein product [Symbiodinium sp. KB8]